MPPANTQHAPTGTNPGTPVEILINNRYRLEAKLNAGSFGTVYRGLDIHTGDRVAIKTEPVLAPVPQLSYELKIYEALQQTEAPEARIGIPRVHWYGREGCYYVLVIDLLGCSLEDLFTLCNRKFSLKTTLMLADQMISRIQYMHNKGYLHRDIKPDNFVIGRDEFHNCVYSIDFGLAKQYRNPETLKHIPFANNRPLIGTARYASVNSHTGVEQSRRDDLEAIGYVLVYFLKGQLPWQGLAGNNKAEKFAGIANSKMATTVRQLCLGLPHEFELYFQHVRSLSFEEKPDYLYLRRLFRELFKRLHYIYDLQYDWIDTLPKSKYGSLIFSNATVTLTEQIITNTDFLFNNQGGAGLDHNIDYNSMSFLLDHDVIEYYRKEGVNGDSKLCSIVPPEFLEQQYRREVEEEIALERRQMLDLEQQERELLLLAKTEKDKQEKTEKTKQKTVRFSENVKPDQSEEKTAVLPRRHPEDVVDDDDEEETYLGDGGVNPDGLDNNLVLKKMKLKGGVAKQLDRGLGISLDMRDSFTADGRPLDIANAPPMYPVVQKDHDAYSLLVSPDPDIGDAHNNFDSTLAEPLIVNTRPDPRNPAYYNHHSTQIPKEIPTQCETDADAIPGGQHLDTDSWVRQLQYLIDPKIRDLQQRPTKPSARSGEGGKQQSTPNNNNSNNADGQTNSSAGSSTMTGDSTFPDQTGANQSQPVPYTQIRPPTTFELYGTIQFAQKQYHTFTLYMQLLCKQMIYIENALKLIFMKRQAFKLKYGKRVSPLALEVLEEEPTKSKNKESLLDLRPAPNPTAPNSILSAVARADPTETKQQYQKQQQQFSQQFKTIQQQQQQEAEQQQQQFDDEEAALLANTNQEAPQGLRLQALGDEVVMLYQQQIIVLEAQLQYTRHQQQIIMNALVTLHHYLRCLLLEHQHHILKSINFPDAATPRTAKEELEAQEHHVICSSLQQQRQLLQHHMKSYYHFDYNALTDQREQVQRLFVQLKQIQNLKEESLFQYLFILKDKFKFDETELLAASGALGGHQAGHMFLRAQQIKQNLIAFDYNAYRHKLMQWRALTNAQTASTYNLPQHPNQPAFVNAMRTSAYSRHQKLLQLGGMMTPIELQTKLGILNPLYMAYHQIDQTLTNTSDVDLGLSPLQAVSDLTRRLTALQDNEDLTRTDQANLLVLKKEAGQMVNVIEQHAMLLEDLNTKNKTVYDTLQQSVGEIVDGVPDHNITNKDFAKLRTIEDYFEKTVDQTGTLEKEQEKEKDKTVTKSGLIMGRKKITRGKAGTAAAASAATKSTSATASNTSTVVTDTTTIKSQTSQILGGTDNNNTSSSGSTSEQPGDIHYLPVATNIGANVFHPGVRTALFNLSATHWTDEDIQRIALLPRLRDYGFNAAVNTLLQLEFENPNLIHMYILYRKYLTSRQKNPRHNPLVVDKSAQLDISTQNDVNNVTSVLKLLLYYIKTLPPSQDVDTTLVTKELTTLLTLDPQSQLLPQMQSNTIYPRIYDELIVNNPGFIAELVNLGYDHYSKQKIIDILRRAEVPLPHEYDIFGDEDPQGPRQPVPTTKQLNREMKQAGMSLRVTDVPIHEEIFNPFVPNHKTIDGGDVNPRFFDLPPQGTLDVKLQEQRRLFLSLFPPSQDEEAELRRLAQEQQTGEEDDDEQQQQQQQKKQKQKQVTNNGVIKRQHYDRDEQEAPWNQNNNNIDIQDVTIQPAVRFVLDQDKVTQQTSIRVVDEHALLKKLNDDHDTRERQMEADAVDVIANTIDQRLQQQNKLQQEQEQDKTTAALALKKKQKEKNNKQVHIQAPGLAPHPEVEEEFIE